MKNLNFGGNSNSQMDLLMSWSDGESFKVFTQNLKSFHKIAKFLASPIFYA